MLEPRHMQKPNAKAALRLQKRQRESKSHSTNATSKIDIAAEVKDNRYFNLCWGFCISIVAFAFCSTFLGHCMKEMHDLLMINCARLYSVMLNGLIFGTFLMVTVTWTKCREHCFRISCKTMKTFIVIYND